MYVAVPVRGVGCIEELAVEVTKIKCCRPREGCGLHPPAAARRMVAVSVAVPVRGVGCILGGDDDE